MVYECMCGYSATTAMAMNMHLKALSADPREAHYLKSSYGLASRQHAAAAAAAGAELHATDGSRQQQQQQHYGGGSGGKVSGSSTPNSLHGFTAVSPCVSGGGDDEALAQAWESVEQYYSFPGSQQQQHGSQRQPHHYPAVPGAHTAAAAADGEQPRWRSLRSSSRAQQPGDASSPGAAAVQFAAGMSLTAAGSSSQQQQAGQQASREAGAAAAALPGLKALSTGDGGAVRGTSQQQQWDGDAGGGGSGAFGVKISGTIMAAMGGWVVNQAISAAATTATAALAGGPESTGGAAADEGARQHHSSRSRSQQQASPPAAPPPDSSSSPPEGATSGSGSWWRRLTPRAETAATAAAADGEAGAAGGEGKKAGLKGSLKAAAKRHSLRRKASANAAAASAGGSRGVSRDGDDDGSEQGASGFGSDGSMEFSQLLNDMDKQLRGAAAAGAAAAGATVAPAAPPAHRAAAAGVGGGGGARLFSAAVAAAADDEDECEDLMSLEDVDLGGGGQPSHLPAGTCWMQAIGLAPGGGSGQAAAAAAAAGAGGAGRDSSSSYLLVSRGQRHVSSSISRQQQQHQPGSSSSSPLAERAHALRSLLLWRQPGSSAKALGLGLYVIMLLSNIPRALHYMQVTTVLPVVALLYLGYNLGKPWCIRLCCSVGSYQPGRAAAMQARLAGVEEAAVRAVVRCAAQAAVGTGEWMLAVLALGHRALRARRFTTTCWTVVTLWLLLLVSELRVLNQTLLVMLAYAGLFCVPWLYKQFRGAIDTVVYDTFHFLTLLLVNAERWAYGLAVAAAAVVWQALAPSPDDAADGSGASLVVRSTAAGAAAFAVLLWRVVVAD